MGQAVFLQTQEAWEGSVELLSHTAPNPHSIPRHAVGTDMEIDR